MIVLIGWSASPADPRIRHFRAGALFGANIEAEFSQSGLFSTGTGALGDFDDGWEFDDGFVRPDDSVSGSAGGYTSHWGYNSPAQYDAASQTLTFSRATGFGATGISSANSDPHIGFDLAYGGSVNRIGRTWILWEAGFSLLPINIRGSSATGATLAQDTYTFNTGGVLLPGAPYTGSPAGGPLLTNQFSSTSTTLASGTLSSTREIDAFLYNLRLGPNVHLDLNRRWSVELMGGFALGFVDGSYDFTERLITATGESVASGSLDQTDWLYGGYAGVLTQIHFEQNAYVYGSAQWMSLGDVDFSGGGRQARLKLDQGLYFSIGFTWLF